MDALLEQLGNLPCFACLSSYLPSTHTRIRTRGAGGGGTDDMAPDSLAGRQLSLGGGKKVQFVKLLGAGGFAFVYLARDAEHHQFAVKVRVHSSQERSELT